MGLYRGKTIYCIGFGKALGFRTHWGLRVLPVDKWGWLKFSPPTSILGHLGKVESPHIHLGEPNNPLTSSWPFFDSRIYSPSSHCSVTLWCGQNNGPTFLFIPLTRLSGSPGHHGNVPCVLPASFPAQGLWSVRTLGIRAGTPDHTTGILAWWLLCPIPVESLPMMVEGSSPTNKGVITLGALVVGGSLWRSKVWWRIGDLMGRTLGSSCTSREWFLSLPFTRRLQASLQKRDKISHP